LTADAPGQAVDVASGRDYGDVAHMQIPPLAVREQDSQAVVEAVEDSKDCSMGPGSVGHLSFGSLLSSSAGLCEGRDLVSDANRPDNRDTSRFGGVNVDGVHKELTYAGGRSSDVTSLGGSATFSGDRDHVSDARSLSSSREVKCDADSVTNIEIGHGRYTGRSVGLSRVELNCQSQQGENVACRTVTAEAAPDVTAGVDSAGADQTFVESSDTFFCS